MRLQVQAPVRECFTLPRIWALSVFSNFWTIALTPTVEFPSVGSLVTSNCCAVYAHRERESSPLIHFLFHGLKSRSSGRLGHFPVKVIARSSSVRKAAGFQRGNERRPTRLLTSGQSWSSISEAVR